jgi:CO/xanthine dehydrogenase Mo-binding subunit
MPPDPLAEVASPAAPPAPAAPATPAGPPGLREPEVRVEGRAKVTGAARFTADVHRPGTLWLAYARSPIPHARIRSIDVSAARTAPGVHAVITGKEIRPARMGRRLLDWPVLAWDRVRFIGDRVAAVAAETRDQARAAADLVHVEYDELPAILDAAEARAPDAPILHDEADSYRYLGGTRPPSAHPNVQGAQRVTRGDVDAGFAASVRVFEHTFTAPRQHQGHIEPHACLVWFEAGILHVISSNKTPFQLRQLLSESLGLAEALIEVESQYIGGDFGGKGMSLDEYACYFLARATGRPIKAVMDGSDELQAANPRHGATFRLQTGVNGEGRFLAHRSSVVFDGGAYAAAKPSAALTPAGGVLTLGAYAVPSVDLDIVTVYTNTVPAGHMRGPGETQALFASESHVDMIAAALAIDPLELRLRNAIRPGESGPTGVVYHESRAVDVLEALRTETAWGAPVRAGHGRGLAMSVRRPGGGKSTVVLRLRPDATIEVVTGAADQGGGSHTAIRRIAAAALSVAETRVVVTFGSTAAGPEDAGAGGSRLTFVNGRAVEIAAAKLKARLEGLVADRLGVEAGSAALVEDRFLVRSAEGESQVRFDEALEHASTDDVEGTFDSRADDEEAAASFVGYLVEVGVDPETGAVQLDQVTLVADIGTVINPVAHTGQLNGGFVFGLGNALMEELVIDEGKVATVGLNDYKLPTTMDVPPLRTILLPSVAGSGAFGGKMVGELTSGAVTAAIANAIADASGARLSTYPLTAERILAAIRLGAVPEPPVLPDPEEPSGSAGSGRR